VIVIDASAALAALLNAGPARQAVSSQQLHCPHLIDVEVANGLRRLVHRRELDPGAGWVALDTWGRLGLMRHPVFALLERVWQLRGNLSAYDAAYVALAEHLGCAVLTCDGRLSRAPGLRCAVTLVPG
jgi:predicted nucleic acid-binding protein